MAIVHVWESAGCFLVVDSSFIHVRQFGGLGCRVVIGVFWLSIGEISTFDLMQRREGAKARRDLLRFHAVWLIVGQRFSIIPRFGRVLDLLSLRLGLRAGQFAQRFPKFPCLGCSNLIGRAIAKGRRV
jgi:hypothetical protein